jgi:uncharacterized Zn finger protein (UPF0148 family)
MFKKILNSIIKSKTDSLLIGITEQDGAKCPMCSTTLSKFPKKSVMCPDCKEKIYVAKRPADDLLVLLDKKQNRRIKDEKKLRSDKEFRKRYDRAYESLKTQFSAEPKHFDIMWRLFNEDIIEVSKQGDSCRGVHVEMVNLCIEEDNYKAALSLCITLMVEDLLHLFPSKNSYDKKTFESISKHNTDMVNPQFTTIAGGIVHSFIECVGQLKLQPEDLKDSFFKELKIQSKKLWAQPNPDKMWQDITKQIEKYQF